MNRWTNKWRVDEAIERIGISDKYSNDLILECINYILDQERILPLSIEGDICKAVRTLYYAGYSDLGPLEGTITILKEIEVIIQPHTIVEKSILTRKVGNFGLLNIQKYLKNLLIINDTLKQYKYTAKTRVRSINDVSLLQLADPFFEHNYAEGKLKVKRKKRFSFNDIGLIEDASSSMVGSKNLEKLASIITSISQTFNTSDITKYRCYDYTIEKVEFGDIPTQGTTSEFNLEYYLDNIPNHKLLIIVTDAHPFEFGEYTVNVPTVLFNLNRKTYSNVNNVTQIKL